jgi:hypothetical protein
MPLQRKIADAVGPLTALPFALASRLRRSKVFHPKGEVRDARVTLSGRPGIGFLGEPGEHQAVARLSRGVGLPESVPDILGLALRLPDVHGPGRHQDFLLATSADAPVAHHVLIPAAGPQQRPYSSLLPYRAGGDAFLIGALPGPAADRYQLAVAAINGRFEPIGEIELLGARPDLDEITFNPWNTGGGISPSGFLNRLRAYVYPASQAGWRAAR